MGRLSNIPLGGSTLKVLKFEMRCLRSCQNWINHSENSVYETFYFLKIHLIFVGSCARSTSLEKKSIICCTWIPQVLMVILRLRPLEWF